MQCREFREISESYFGDELLVETNLKIFHHLEHCRDCRAYFATSKELRTKLRAAARSAEEFQIDPVFQDRLKVNLRASALRESAWAKLYFGPTLLVPIMACLLLAVLAGISYVSFGGGETPTFIARDAVIEGLNAISVKAVGDHKDCALEKLQAWHELSKLDYAKKAYYSDTVLQPLKSRFSSDLELLHAHDCIFDGKKFTHVIIKNGPHIVSVLFDKDDRFQQPVSATDSIISNEAGGLQVASFRVRDQAVFVVSDMPETDNLSAARILSASLNAQNAI
jgi:hypothetical protein